MSSAATAVGTKQATIPQTAPGSPEKHEWARQVPGNGSNARNTLFAAMNRRWVHISYALLDLSLIGLSGVLAFTYRFAPFGAYRALHLSGFEPGADLLLKPHVGFLLLYAILIVLVFQANDLYRTPRDRTVVGESWAVFRGVVFATMVLAAFIFCTNVKIVSREVVTISATLNVLLLASWRVWKRQFIIRRVQQGLGARNVLIVGAGNVGQRLAQYLDQNKQLGYRVTGFLHISHFADPRMLGKIEDLPQIARAKFVDDVFLTLTSDRELIRNVAGVARGQHLNVRIIPEPYEGFPWTGSLRFLGDFPVLDLHGEALPTFGLFLKRMLDIILSSLALVILSPLFLLLMIAIKLDSRGDVFYPARRVGGKGVLFTCYKFRSMIKEAEQCRAQLDKRNERSNGLLFKIKDDPRITRLGKFLRKSSLDELPQFWNVLKGDMSLVGPRPPLPREFEQYSLEHFRRLDMKPGLTGLWQVTARPDPSFEHYIALDLEYIERWSLLLDLKILARTIPALLRAEGS